MLAEKRSGDCSIGSIETLNAAWQTASRQNEKRSRPRIVSVDQLTMAPRLCGESRKTRRRALRAQPSRLRCRPRPLDVKDVKQCHAHELPDSPTDDVVP